MKDPILTSVYRLFAFLSFIAAALCIVGAILSDEAVAPALMAMAICIFAGIVFLGVAEVILLIAKIEFNTGGGSQGGAGVEKLQREIASSLKQLVEAARATAALPPIPGEERYFIATDGKAEGPYRIGDLQALADKGAISGESLFIEEGGKTWRKISTLCG